MFVENHLFVDHHILVGFGHASIKFINPEYDIVPCCM